MREESSLGLSAGGGAPALLGSVKESVVFPFLVQGAVLVGFCLCAVVLASLFYRVAGAFNRRWQLGTAVIGVPVHELAHALFCVVFGMRLREIRFFRPDPQSGQLGYVNFTYKRFSVIHRVGLFFVGVAPLLAGACIVYWGLEQMGVSPMRGFLSIADVSADPRGFMGAVLEWLARLLEVALSSWLHFVLVFAISAVALHSAPSWADVAIAGKGALFAWLFLAMVALALSRAAAVAGAGLDVVSAASEAIFIAMSQLAILMGMFSLVGLLVFLPFRLFVGAFR